VRRGLYAGIVVLGALIGAPSASADDSALSTRLQELATKDLRDASHADQADAVSLLAHGAGSLARADGGLLVEIRVDGNDHERAQALQSAGAEVLHVSHDYDTVTATVDESDLRAVANVPGVEYVGEVITPMVGSVDGPDGAAPGLINTCQTGVVTEGNTQLKAGAARTQFDVDGTGVKVGILSDSYDTNAGATKHAADDVASGDLPGAANPCGRTTPVKVLQDDPAQGDEGRAMLQIVHDIAPGADLDFATAFLGQTSFADNIRALANDGAKIIADDIINFTEPMYQDGIIAKAVNDVSSQGVAYFSMAFNNNGLGINSYEAPNGFRSTSCPAAILADRAGGQDSCMDFDPSASIDNTFDVNVAAGAPFRLSVSWAEPQFGVNDDFDVYVLNGGSFSLAAKSDNIASGVASEFGGFTVGSAGARAIVIRRYAGTGTPAIKLVSNDNGANTWTSTQTVTAPDVQGPTIYGHNGAAAAETVGAVPFSNSNTMETFSGRGPVTSVFEPLNGTTPSPAFSSKRVLNKPDISATDRGITTFFGPGNRFSGTSAATPHAAAVGALQLAANPTLTAADIFAAQEATAHPVGAFGPNDMGAGLIDAQAAIASKPPAPPPITFTGGPSGLTTDNNPTFTFTVGAHPNTITCSLDSGAPQACTNAFATGPVADGAHSVTVSATDFFSQSGTASQSFNVDTTGPAPPTIAKGPKKKSKTNKAKFTFSGEAGGSFQCSLDNAAFAACASPVTVKVKKPKKKPKKHTFEIEQTDALGNVGTPVTYKWKVVKKKKKHHHHHH
jgi:hypothetical protein